LSSAALRPTLLPLDAAAAADPDAAAAALALLAGEEAAAAADADAALDIAKERMKVGLDCCGWR